MVGGHDLPRRVALSGRFAPCRAVPPVPPCPCAPVPLCPLCPCAPSLQIESTQGVATAQALRRAGREALARLHEEIRATGHTHGSTLTVAMVNRTKSELTTLSLGDSSALLLHHQPGVADTQRLTAEHRLQDSARERARVAALGGVVARIRHPVTGEPGGPLRCFPGGLAIARGLGDADAGDLVSAIPATSTVSLSASAGWDVVIASDGVWDSLPPHDVVKLCRLSKGVPPAKTAALVVDAAVSKRHAFDNSGAKQPRDDTTAVVIRSRGLAEESRGGGCQVGERCDRSKFDMSLIAADPVVLDDHVRDELVEALDPSGGGGRGGDPGHKADPKALVADGFDEVRPTAGLMSLGEPTSRGDSINGPVSVL